MLETEIGYSQFSPVKCTLLYHGINMPWTVVAFVFCFVMFCLKPKIVLKTQF